MSTIWRFTGNPENWLTAIGVSRWALNESNKSLWQRDIHPGDIVIFHATRKSDFSDQVVSSVIGFGYVGDGLFIKNEFWWVQETRDQKNHWPYVVPLREMYLFSDTKDIDFTVPVHEKPPSQVVAEIERLLSNALAVADLNAKAKAQDPNCPNFPVNGSASRLNKLFEELILEQNQDLFIPHETQAADLLEGRLNETIDEQLAKLDKETILAQAQAFDNSGAESHYLTQGSQKVRRENRIQKRRVAALEDYTCQLCGFRYEYLKKEGKRAWIIHVDHILEKSEKGTEKLKNLWVLCPNCHAKKTCGIIKIDLEAKKITEGESEIKLVRDSHLFV